MIPSLCDDFHMLLFLESVRPHSETIKCHLTAGGGGPVGALPLTSRSEIGLRGHCVEDPGYPSTSDSWLRKTGITTSVIRVTF